MALAGPQSAGKQSGPLSRVNNPKPTKRTKPECLAAPEICRMSKGARSTLKSASDKAFTTTQKSIGNALYESIQCPRFFSIFHNSGKNATNAMLRGCKVSIITAKCPCARPVGEFWPVAHVQVLQKHFQILREKNCRERCSI